MADEGELNILECLSQLLRKGMPQLCDQVAGISLSLQTGPVPVQSWGTVYTIAQGAAPLILAMHTPEPVARRASAFMLGEEALCDQDLEECAIEYMNVIAGWAISQLYQKIGEKVRLYPPVFRAGRYFPASVPGYEELLHFATDRGEGVALHWSSPTQGIPQDELILFGGDNT